MASYREAAKEPLEVAFFKAASQLDLAFLRDHKKYAALRILKRERCTSHATGSGKSLFSVSVFLNFAKGMIPIVLL